jgi:hypothetical protein
MQILRDKKRNLRKDFKPFAKEVNALWLRMLFCLSRAKNRNVFHMCFPKTALTALFGCRVIVVMLSAGVNQSDMRRSLAVLRVEIERLQQPKVQSHQRKVDNIIDLFGNATS